MYRLFTSISTFLFLIFVLQVASAADNFFVNIRGVQSQIESVKKRSEYRMSKNVDFCRGVKMPKAIAGWKCKKNNQNQVACYRQYKCTFVDKNFNRKSESLRTYQAMKGMTAITSSYSIALSTAPKLQPKVRAVVKKQVIKPRPTPTPVATPEPSYVEDLFAQEKEPELIEEKKDFLEQAYADERPVEKEPIKTADSYQSQWSWLRFDGFLTQTSEDSGSQTAFEAGWRPRWKFSQRWSLDARVGFSQRRAIADSEEEAFSVIETGAWLGRRFGNWRLAAGFGRQSWSGEPELGNQTPTFMSGSVSYLWSDVKFLSLEGMEFQYLALSDEASSTVMRIGFLFNF